MKPISIVFHFDVTRRPFFSISTKRGTLRMRILYIAEYSTFINCGCVYPIGVESTKVFSLKFPTMHICIP